MARSTGHPDDEQLERFIETERMALSFARTREDRRRAWQALKDLIAQRSRRQIAFMESERIRAGGGR